MPLNILRRSEGSTDALHQSHSLRCITAIHTAVLSSIADDTRAPGGLSDSLHSNADTGAEVFRPSMKDGYLSKSIHSNWRFHV
jgi:hypothetical protein